MAIQSSEGEAHWSGFALTGARGPLQKDYNRRDIVVFNVQSCNRHGEVVICSKKCAVLQERSSLALLQWKVTTIIVPMGSLVKFMVILDKKLHERIKECKKKKDRPLKTQALRITTTTMKYQNVLI